MNEFIKEEFQFLVDQHSFTQALQGDLMSYESTDLIVRPSFNERDGFSTDIVVPARGSQEISVGTILAALESDGPRNVVSWSDDIRREASFLKAHVERLLNMPENVYDDCCALRFWHGNPWRSAWGSTMVMNAESIAKEKARLFRIRKYFGE